MSYTRTERIKSSMAKESKRIDLILDELEQPQLVNVNPGRTPIVLKKTTGETVNDYLDLYKNFAEFNAKNNPDKVNELMKIDPYYVQQPYQGPAGSQAPARPPTGHFGRTAPEQTVNWVPPSSTFYAFPHRPLTATPGYVEEQSSTSPLTMFRSKLAKAEQQDGGNLGNTGNGGMSGTGAGGAARNGSDAAQSAGLLRSFKARMQDPYQPSLPPLPLAEVPRPAGGDPYLPAVDAQGRQIPVQVGLMNNASVYTNDNFMDYEELSVERVPVDSTSAGQWGVRRYN